MSLVSADSRTWVQILLSIHCWLVQASQAWVLIPFAAIFADIPQAEKAYDVLFSFIEMQFRNTLLLSRLLLSIFCQYEVCHL